MTVDLTVLFAELDEYATLGPNWDGEDAAPISAATVADAKALLRDIAAEAAWSNVWIEPSIGPTPDGEIGFWWDWDECGGRSVSIEFQAGKPLCVIQQVKGKKACSSWPPRQSAIMSAVWAMLGAAQATDC